MRGCLLLVFYKKRRPKYKQITHCVIKIFTSHITILQMLSITFHLPLTFFDICAKSPFSPWVFGLFPLVKNELAILLGKIEMGPAGEWGKWCMAKNMVTGAPISLTKANNISRLWAVSQAQDLSGALLRGVDHLLYCRTRILPAIFHKPFSVGIDVILISMLLV